LKKVVFFVTSLDSGGLENYLLRFLNYKHEAFEEIIVYCKGGYAGQLENEFLKIPNVKIHLEKVSYYNPSTYFNIFQFFKINHIDVVCDFTGNFAGLILLSAWFAKVSKRVAFYRGATDHFKNNKLRTLYNNFVKLLVFKFSTDILSNSRAAFHFFYPQNWQDDSRFKVISNGINSQELLKEKDDLRREFAIPSNAFVVGHIGRFNEAKNHTTILNVAINLCTHYDDIYFFLCGNGVVENLQYLVKKENLEERIILQNNRRDVVKVLNTINCFYFPSITEGQPNALLEAMVLGVPVIPSDIEPIKECVPDYFIKELINPYDMESAIDKILKIRNGHDLINLQNWAIEEFNHEILFENFFQVLIIK
jgi:glycosyltransferase involved in cell wall biosynthesis